MFRKLYLAYGFLVLGGTGFAQYRGWSLDSINQVKNVPKSIRDNPGCLSFRSTAAITITPEANKMNLVPLGNVVSALVFAFIGILIFIIAFVVIDKLTPYHLWKEIVQEHNMALAILIGAMSIGICIIIAAAYSSSAWAFCSSSPSCWCRVRPHLRALSPARWPATSSATASSSSPPSSAPTSSRWASAALSRAI